MKNFTEQLEFIRYRNWRIIKYEWIKYIPNITPKGSAPEFVLGELLEFKNYAFEAFNENRMDEIFKTQDSTLRTFTFWEAIYFLHKALHTLSLAQISAKRGNQTWSLSTSYHSSIFSAKSIIYLMGIGLPVYEDKSKAFIMDIWHETTKSYDPFKRKRIENYRDIAITGLDISGEVQHRHIWSIFLRILNASTVSFWPKEIVNSIRKLDVQIFSHQRNHIHYRNNDWLFDDLYTPRLDKDFGYKELILQEGFEFENLKSDFSMLMAFSIFYLAYLLLKDLATLSNKILPDFQMIKNNFQDINYHPIYSHYG